MFCLKVQQSSGPRNLPCRGVGGCWLGLGGSTSEQGFTDFGRPYQMAQKLNWVSLASEQAVPERKIRWFIYDLMSTLMFFWGVSFPDRNCRETKKRHRQTPTHKPTKLEVLRLADNQIGDQGAKALVTLLGDKLKGWSNGGLPSLKLTLVGGFKYFLFSPPTWGND